MEVGNQMPHEQPRTSGNSIELDRESLDAILFMVNLCRQEPNLN